MIKKLVFLISQINIFLKNFCFKEGKSDISESFELYNNSIKIYIKTVETSLMGFVNECLHEINQALKQRNVVDFEDLQTNSEKYQFFFQIF